LNAKTIPTRSIPTISSNKKFEMGSIRVYFLKIWVEKRDLMGENASVCKKSTRFRMNNTRFCKKYSNPEQGTKKNDAKEAAKRSTNPTHGINPAPQQINYFIIQCYSCGQLLLAKAGQKTKACTYCGARLNLSHVKILSRARTAKEASEIIKALKREQVKNE